MERRLSLFRGVLVCERCFEALGAVYARAVVENMSARLVTVMWPEFEERVYDVSNRHQLKKTRWGALA
jgi:hypothetical protein